MFATTGTCRAGPRLVSASPASRGPTTAAVVRRVQRQHLLHFVVYAQPLPTLRREWADHCNAKPLVQSTPLLVVQASSELQRCQQLFHLPRAEEQRQSLLSAGNCLRMQTLSECPVAASALEEQHCLQQTHAGIPTPPAPSIKASLY